MTPCCHIPEGSMPCDPFKPTGCELLDWMKENNMNVPLGAVMKLWHDLHVNWSYETYMGRLLMVEIEFQENWYVKIYPKQ